MSEQEKIIVARHSGFNLLVVTEDALGLRTLRFGHEGVCQSIVKVGDPQHLELPYATVLPLCLALAGKPSRALIIGLGGGTLPNFFHRQFPNLSVEVVELDPDVLQIAKSYFDFQEDPRLKVWIEDGRDFIENTQTQFDLVVLDSFDAESIPTHLRTLEFLLAAKNILSPAGIVVANIWGRKTNPLYDSMLLTYRKAFEDLFIFDVQGPGTKIFVGLAHRQTIAREELLKRADEISTTYGFRHPLSASLTGFRHASAEVARGGSVLRD